MKRVLNIKRTVLILIFTISSLLVYSTAFAEETADITWTTGFGEVILSDDINQELHTVYYKSLNDITISFNDPNVERATLLIVPVSDDTTEMMIKNSAVYVAQMPVEQGVARFDFYFTSDIRDGIYAILVGGYEAGYSTKYFKVNTKRIPKIKDNQVIQYDDYKEKIVLEFEDNSEENINTWIAQKENTSIVLSCGEKTVDIQSSDVSYDSVNKTIAIDTKNYTEIFPDLGTKSNGNIQQTTISISNPEFWGDETFGGKTTQTFGLVIREFSADGFKNGIDFDISVHSNRKLENVRFIIALYDPDKLISAVSSELMTIEAGKNITISSQFKVENIEPSGKYKVKVFMWDDKTLEPYVTAVSF